MKAWIIREFGKPNEVLELANVLAADLPDKHVRVAFLAAPINPADLNWIEGTYGTRPVLPETPGTEGVAEVIESRDERYQIGDRVMFLGYAHSWQQQRVVDADELWKVPSHLPIAEMAMLKVNPATAWCLLHKFVSIPAGGVVLQNAANSAVGRCVIQIARALGLRTVNFVRNADLLREELMASGADAVFSDDDAGAEQAKQWLSTQQKPVLACNAVGGESALRQLSLLAPGGIHVTYGAMSRRPLTVPNKFLIFQDIQIRGFWLTHWLTQVSRATLDETYGSLTAMIESKQLQQVVDSSYHLDDLRLALQRLTASDRRGKVLLHC